MKTLIEKIRNKPHHKRNQIIWVCAGVMAMILLIIWVIVGNPRKTNNGGEIIETFNQDFNDSKDDFPSLQQP